MGNTCELFRLESELLSSLKGNYVSITQVWLLAPNVHIVPSKVALEWKKRLSLDHKITKLIKNIFPWQSALECDYIYKFLILGYGAHDWSIGGWTACWFGPGEY